jgi:hypothetical protein
MFIFWDQTSFKISSIRQVVQFKINISKFLLQARNDSSMEHLLEFWTLNDFRFDDTSIIPTKLSKTEAVHIGFKNLVVNTEYWYLLLVSFVNLAIRFTGMFHWKRLENRFKLYIFLYRFAEIAIIQYMVVLQ